MQNITVELSPSVIGGVTVYLIGIGVGLGRALQNLADIKQRVKELSSTCQTRQQWCLDHFRGKGE